MTEIFDLMHKEGVYTLTKPMNKKDMVPLLFDSPHSGRIYPKNFNPLCTQEDLERAEDRFVDHLFADIYSYGATLLCAEFPRTYIDPNRHETDLHPRLIKDSAHDLSLRPTTKANAGIGLIHEHLNNGQKLYNHPLKASDIQERIAQFYKLYHHTLKNEISRLRDNFSEVLHINCHSMPSFTSPKSRQISNFSKKPFNKQRTDIILGTLDGQSCSDEWADYAYEILRDIGFSVMMNKPFKGAEIVKRYGDPDNHIHSIQLELNRHLYLDQNEHQKSEYFQDIKEALNKFTTQLSTELSLLR